MSRIVSMIASATEIVCALGQLPSLVGRSHECDYPAEIANLPACTRPRFDVSGSSREIDNLVKCSLSNALSIYEVFDDVLERLQPTHIITQTQCEVCAVSLRDVEQSIAANLASRPRIVSLQPNSIADIWDDIRRVALSLEIEAKGEQLVAGLKQRMQETSRRVNGASPQPTVACIEWLEPLMASGNWTPELIEMAGGINLFGEAGRHSPWMSWDELFARDPDVIVASPCGFDLARTAAEMYWLTGHRGWSELKAVRSGRVYLADGNQYFNRPGPRVAESLEIMTEILWPDWCPPGWKQKAWLQVKSEVQ